MKISFRILSLVFIFSVFIAGCKKDDSNPAGSGDNGGNSTYTITLNGDGFSNKQVTPGSTATTAYAMYSPTQQKTGGYLACSDNINVSFFTQGQQTGTFNFSVGDNDSDPEVGLIVTSGTGTSMKIYYGKTGSGSITITSYGSVGGQIKGTFTGKIYNSTTDAEVTISGSFSATRIPDGD